MPAALNGIVGLKPSLGLISSTGVVPACRTLDTVSILATNVADAWSVLSCTALYDENDNLIIGAGITHTAANATLSGTTQSSIGSLAGAFNNVITPINDKSRPLFLVFIFHD